MASTIAAVKSTRIAIIGAGISGLAAAERLLQLGYSDIFILEATDRIGGRICTKSFGNGWVELGAQWIHGEDDNSAYKYAIQHDLVASDKKKPSPLDAEIRLDNGTVIEESLADKICDRFDQSLHEIHEGVSKDAEQMTVESYIDRAFQDEFNSSKCVEELEQKKALLKWRRCLQCSIDGCDSLSQLSLKSFAQYKECEGNPLIDFKKGYSSLIDSFTAKIPNNMIHLCKPVVCIEQMTPSHPGLPGQYKTATIRIKCQDGSTCIADHVIVTVSLGHLKQNALTLFMPPLSSDKLNAIQKLGFGTVDKIFIEFERAFWPKDSLGYSLAWRTMNSNSGSSKPWYQGIFGFYTVPFASNVLCGWISGAEARQMECLSEAEIKDTCIRVLQRFTGIASLPAVKAIARSVWHNNPYTRGSYSYFTPVQCSNSCLAEPITVAFGNAQCPVVLFAGEATHPHYYSTVHGAMETGWREADRIIAYYALSTQANL